MKKQHKQNPDPSIKIRYPKEVQIDLVDASKFRTNEIAQFLGMLALTFSLDPHVTFSRSNVILFLLAISLYAWSYHGKYKMFKDVRKEVIKK